MSSCPCPLQIARSRLCCYWSPTRARGVVAQRCQLTEETLEDPQPPAQMQPEVISDTVKPCLSVGGTATDRTPPTARQCAVEGNTKMPSDRLEPRSLRYCRRYHNPKWQGAVGVF